MLSEDEGRGQARQGTTGLGDKMSDKIRTRWFGVGESEVFDAGWTMFTATRRQRLQDNPGQLHRDLIKSDNSGMKECIQLVLDFRELLEKEGENRYGLDSSKCSDLEIK